MFLLSIFVQLVLVSLGIYRGWWTRCCLLSGADSSVCQYSNSVAEQLTFRGHIAGTAIAEQVLFFFLHALRHSHPPLSPSAVILGSHIHVFSACHPKKNLSFQISPHLPTCKNRRLISVTTFTVAGSYWVNWENIRRREMWENYWMEGKWKRGPGSLLKGVSNACMQLAMNSDVEMSLFFF